MSQEIEHRTDGEVEQAFEARLRELRPHLEEISSTEQDLLEAGRMVLAYKPPSTRTSQQYRDSVLWCSILRVATDCQVLFVTNDGGFYREKNSDEPALAIGNEIDEPLRREEIAEIRANFITAVAEAIGTPVEQNGGYVVGQDVNSSIELYLTENPRRLAMSGDVEYYLADPEFTDSADPAAAAMVSAIAAVDLDDLEISDIQLESLRVDTIMPHGDFTIADIRYVQASDHIGTRWRHYTLRTKAPKRAPKVDRAEPTTSGL